MKSIINQALQNAMSFEEYKNLFENLVLEGKTTGPNQSEGYVSFTKLNLSRYHRASKFVELTQTTVNKLAELSEPLMLLLITEAWCGDAAQIIPVLEQMAEVQPLINHYLILRDEHLDIMDAFLTNGARAIPVTIVIDKESNEVLGHWGPRPEVLQQQVMQAKAATRGSQNHCRSSQGGHPKMVRPRQDLLYPTRGSRNARNIARGLAVVISLFYAPVLLVSALKCGK